MFDFLNRPSLASGIAACIAGFVVLAVGAYYGAMALAAIVAGVFTTPTWTMTGAGLSLLLGGSILLGLGIRAIERFERKLLISIASRGRLEG